MVEAPHDDEAAPPATFHVGDAAATLLALADVRSFVVEPEQRWFDSTDGRLRIHPPLVAPIDPECGGLFDYVGSLPERLGAHAVVLMQAGATSLGWFEDGASVETKSFRRYVVRGTGRAQPTHLKSKGKSRYGSRLRLQNADLLMSETSERLVTWWETFGPPQRLFVSCPVRLWASLFDADPRPPFGRDVEVTRIPRDLPRPTSDLVVRTYRFLCHGRVERLAD
jgi:hypothetical protein